MTRPEFMALCRQHVSGDDPPLVLSVYRPSQWDFTGDASVTLTVTRSSGSYVSTVYVPSPGRQHRDFDKRDRLLAAAMAKYTRWLTEFRGSPHQ